MSCTRTQCSVSVEAGNSDPSIPSQFQWLYSAGEFTVTMFRNGNSRTFNVLDNVLDPSVIG